MSDQKQNAGPGPLILFPEVIGGSILAIFFPLLLADALHSGHVFIGITGFVFWLAALFFAVRFILQQQYTLVWVTMIVMIGSFFVIKKLSGL